MKEVPGKEDYTYGVLLPSALTESFEIVLARISDLHNGRCDPQREAGLRYAT
jgi:hypothetical protein